LKAILVSATATALTLMLLFKYLITNVAADVADFPRYIYLLAIIRDFTGLTPPFALF